MRKRVVAAMAAVAMVVGGGSAAAADTVTYTDAQAGYAVDYPAQAGLTSGFDAALGYDTVFIRFPSDVAAEYSGVVITVLDNPERLTIDAFARVGMGLQRDAPGEVHVEWIGGMPVLWATRPSPLAGEYAAAALIEGDGVVIRIGLHGGGSDGPIEPLPQDYAWYDQIVRSIRRVPRQAPSPPAAVAAPGVDPPAGAIFQMPFNVPVELYYAEQYGVAVSNTAYAVRNLGLEHRRTCFGVDWPWLLHSGVDWFRADGQDATPTDVVAVADGIVDWYDPNYNTYPGKVVIVRHRLTDGRDLYSMYAHLGPDVSIVQGQIVLRGQRIGSLLYQAGNTHLHFELRRFLDGRYIYGSYTLCNSDTLYAGRGYTYRTHPDNFPAPGAGYVDPVAFIAANGGNTQAPASSATVAAVLTSTLPLAGSGFTMAGKDGAPVTVPLLAQPDVPERARADAIVAAPLAVSDVLTPTIYLPFVVRNYPPQQPACVEGQLLLVNAGLEGGPASAPWVQSSNGAADLIQEDRPYSGLYGLWFGGRDLADEEALQSFVLPYYTQGITLTFQRYLTTQETELVPYDRLEAVIENQSGVEVTPRFVLDNTAGSKDQWVTETIVLTGMESLGGRRLQLSLKMATDASLVTSVFVDEMGAATHCEP